MNQLAWLDFYCGQWRLATSVRGNPVRKWVDREIALSDLAGEGWIAVEPLSEQVSDLNSKRSALRFTLTRTIQ